MAIKYGRGGYRKDAPGETVETSGWARRPLDPKRRLLYIYIGVFMFLIVLLVFEGLGLRKSLSLGPPVEGTATVVSKSFEGGVYVVTVEVEIPTTDAPDVPKRTLRDDVRVPKDSYDLVETGDTLRVTYQLNENSSAIVIRGLSVIPEESPESPDETAP